MSPRYGGTVVWNGDGRRVYTQIVVDLMKRRKTQGLVIVLGLYALVAFVAPLLHHDFECHLKSRLHCDACTASPAASRIEPGVKLFVYAAPRRPEVPESFTARHWVERPASPGRAPPPHTSFA